MKNHHSRRGGIVGLGVAAVIFGGAASVIANAVALLAIGGIALAVGTVVGIMATPQDLTTHNRQDKPQKEIEQLTESKTGDENADAIIAKGQEMLRQIRAENNAIPDQKLTAQMFELERMCLQIFKTVAEKPAKASQIRKFMNYYLPTTLKMLASYRTMQNRGVSRGELMNARDTLIRGMDMVLTACQKQLDNLFKDDMLDVSTDIDVLEQMLKRDGFADGGLGNIPQQPVQVQPLQTMQQTPAEPAAQQAPDQSQVPMIQYQPRTAASAQMGTGAHPTLHVDADGDGQDDFQSYYHQKR